MPAYLHQWVSFRKMTVKSMNYSQ